jgi:2-dehydro-3-deoxyphosphogluconate aldolase/(4S)-4-hydroxy-2-oxoglutarate aldolase
VDSHRHALSERLRAAGAVAVLRGPDHASAVRAAACLLENGIRAIEITFTIPRADEAIAELAARYRDGDVLIGAGTLTDAAQVRTAHRAGARFLVSPGTSTDVLAAMAATDALAIPGAMTPSEVMHARRGGADAIKLFPAAALGPDHLRALRGPFPDTRFLPTGGVSPASIPQWLDAGAFAVGVGSELCSYADVAAGRLDGIAVRARSFVAALRGPAPR